MPTIGDFPPIVKEALEVFGAVCPHEPERRHVAAYLTGLHHLHAPQRGYVGDVQRNRKGVYEGRGQKLSEVAKQVPAEANKPIRVGEKTYGYFTRRMRIPDVDHPVRVVLC